MKLVGLFDLRSGAWLAVARGGKHDGEAKLVRRLFRHLRPGDTLVGDRGFCSYAMICELHELPRFGSSLDCPWHLSFGALGHEVPGDRIQYPVVERSGSLRPGTV